MLDIITNGTKDQSKMIKAIILAALCVVTLADPVRQCAHRTSHDYIRDHTDRCVFWHCVWEKPVEQRCAPGTRVPSDYDSNLPKYDIRYVAPCIVTPGKCVVITTWTAWTPVGVCSKSCGAGIQNYQRTCSGGNCPSPSTVRKTEYCNIAPCPTTTTVIDITWSVWMRMGTCSKTCDAGTMKYYRTCTGTHCPINIENKYVPCNNGACHIWSGWENMDSPTTGDGDWEVDQNYCGTTRSATDAECRVVGSHNTPAQTGLIYKLPCGTHGIGCVHKDNNPNWKPGQANVCKDMEIRLKCSLF